MCYVCIYFYSYWLHFINRVCCPLDFEGTCLLFCTWWSTHLDNSGMSAVLFTSPQNKEEIHIQHSHIKKQKKISFTWQNDSMYLWFSTELPLDFTIDNSCECGLAVCFDSGRKIYIYASHKEFFRVILSKTILLAKLGTLWVFILHIFTIRSTWKNSICETCTTFVNSDTHQFQESNMQFNHFHWHFKFCL